MSSLKTISRTAIYVAAGRAVGAREADPSVRNPDYLAEKLLGDPGALDLDLPIVRALSLSYDDAMHDIEVASNVRMMIIRTRFIDEALARAVASGATQVLILGAGLDSHAYRCQDLLRDVRVFEVDRPVTQNFKKQRVSEVLGEPPGNLTYVPIDFQDQELGEVLAQHGYDFSQRTFVIMEGLTMYLPEEALRSTFRLLATHPVGSSVVFDFVSHALVQMLKHIDPALVPEVVRPAVERFLYLIRDEPWLFGFPQGEEREYLGEFGFALAQMMTVGGDESAQRYLTKADGTQVGTAPSAELARPGTDSVEPAHGSASAVSRAQLQMMTYLMVEATLEAVAK
jgi:methyltransferase (TIGR00027 family)